MKAIRFILLLLVASSFTFPAKEVKLEYAFKVGDQYDWIQSSTQKVKQEIPGMGEMTVDVQLTGEMKLNVKELTPTGARFEAQYTKLKMNTKNSMGMGDTSMDSEATDDGMQTKLVKAMMGKTFSFKMSKQGVIEAVEGTDNLYSGFSALGLDEAALAGAKQSFQQTLGEKSLKASFEMALINYPEKKIKIGDSWQSTGNLAMNFPVKIENTWNLKSHDATSATVDAEGVLTTTDKEKEVSLPNGMKSKFDLNGRQMLSGAVDVKTGFPSEIKVISEIKGSMTLLAGGMIPEDMLVPMEITSESSYKMIKK